MRSAERKTKPAPRRALPPLMNGDRLSQPEFRRRYASYPPAVKIELVGGVVYVSSPQRRRHGQHQPMLSGVVWLYTNATPGIELLDNTTTILGPESEPQPDLQLRVLAAFGGQSKETRADYVKGPPELVMEVSHSTISIDMHDKRDDYGRGGVCEYVVVCVQEQELHSFNFRTGRPILPDRDGIYRSQIFPGLWIDGRALFALNSRRLIEVVQQGIASPEHAAFVKRLQAGRRKRSR
jgi:Uma2 family endonuclease